MDEAKYYPWQIVSRAFNLDLACRLPLDFDVAALQSEVSAILETYDLTRQFGKYHDGGWKAISLMAGGGDYKSNRATTDIQKTEPLRNSPYLSKVLDPMSD